MKDSWQAYLQLGIVHFMAFPECLGGDGPLRETLAEICHDPFFEAVDVGPMNDPAVRQDCAKLLRDSRMTVTFACQPLQLRHNLDLNAADRAERQKAVDTVLGCLDQAKELGAERLALMSGRNVESAQQPAALERLIGELRRVCNAAQQRGLPVVLEIFDYDVDKKALIGHCQTAATLARVLRRDYPDFGLLHDLSHIYLCHEEPARHFPLIREYLTAMHMGNSVSRKDHPLYGDSHPPFGIDGGDSDVPELRGFIKTLFDIGYLRPGRRPVCAFEVRTPQGMDPRTVIANMKRTWQRAWWEL